MRHRHSDIEVREKLHEAAGLMAAGHSITAVIGRLGIGAATFHRWKADHKTYWDTVVRQAHQKAASMQLGNPAPPPSPESAQAGGFASRSALEEENKRLRDELARLLLKERGFN